MIELPGHCDEGAVVRAVRRRGLHVEGAAWHRADPARSPPAIILGYGAATVPAIIRGVGILAAA